MNNDNNKQDKDQDAVESKAAEATVQATAGSQKRGGGILSVINLLLIIGLAGAAGWFWLTQWQSHLGTTASTATALEDKVDSLNHTLKQQTTSGKQLRQGISMLQDSQEALQKQLMTIDGRRSHDWVFAETEYLIRLSGRKLWLEQDIASAIALLNSADLRVASLADSSLLGLRRALANDIASLKTLPLIDIDGITLALDGIIGQLDKLPINLVELAEATDVSNNEVSDSAEDWQQNLGKVWDDLVDDFISVHRRKGEIQPLLSVDQRWYLTANLRLALQQAQLAALKHQQDRYDSGLALAKALLETYYDQDDVAVVNTLKTLNGLSDKTIEQQMPGDLKSRALLAELLETRAKGIPEGTLGLAKQQGGAL